MKTNSESILLGLVIWLCMSIAAWPEVIPVQPVIPVQHDTQQSSQPSINDITTNGLFILLDERDRQYKQRFEDSEKAVNAALVAAKEAVNAALAAAKEAVTKAETANEKRLDNVNEFRGQLKDQAATLLPRAEADIRFRSIENELSKLSDAVLSGTGKFEGAQWLWGIIGALIGGIIAIITVGLSIRNAFPRKP